MFIYCSGVGLFVVFNIRTADFSWLNYYLSKIGMLNTIFLGILMQAFPFMLIGVLVSSVMHIFIPDDWTIKAFPTKHKIGLPCLLLTGFICRYENTHALENDKWVKIIGTIDKIEFEGDTIPIINVKSIEETNKPSDEYIYPNY